MSIIPLPQFETDVSRYREQLAESAGRLSTITVRYGKMRIVAELPYRGDTLPVYGCKLVLRTRRGTEMGTMLTAVCDGGDGGDGSAEGPPRTDFAQGDEGDGLMCGGVPCRSAVRAYVENSGGKDYPFTERGDVLRMATAEDLQRQTEIESRAPALIKDARERVRQHKLSMKIVDVEPILGGELLTFYFLAEDRVDFRSLVGELASAHHARIELRQVGARDEARLVADYEKCGQECCCRQFLKVLRPVSMRAAKMQKATLDPVKISGRCGRLMCCLRYEQQTYDALRKLLPHRKTRVGTPDGPGIVLSTQVLTQLVQVELEANKQRIAVSVADLCDPDACPVPAPLVMPEPMAGGPGESPRRKRRRKRGGKRSRPAGDQPTERDRTGAAPTPADESGAPDQAVTGAAESAGTTKRRRRRRKRSTSNRSGIAPSADRTESAPVQDGLPGRTGDKKRRRRRKNRGDRPQHPAGGHGAAPGGSGSDAPSGD
ncbi:MAG: hypothetical protein KAS72_04655 [Phycisphaerales bacterium]|nr:hypothetical protein [Phycisphaerales bacterium]